MASFDIVVKRMISIFHPLLLLPPFLLGLYHLLPYHLFLLKVVWRKVRREERDLIHMVRLPLCRGSARGKTPSLPHKKPLVPALKMPPPQLRALAQPQLRPPSHLPQALRIRRHLPPRPWACLRQFHKGTPLTACRGGILLHPVTSMVLQPPVLFLSMA